MLAAGWLLQVPELKRQYAPQHFKDRLAVASDVRMIQAQIGFFGHPGS